MKKVSVWILGIVAILLTIVFHGLIAFFKICLPIWASILYGVAVAVLCIGFYFLLNNIFGD